MARNGLTGARLYLARFLQFPGRRALIESAAGSGVIIREPWSSHFVLPVLGAQCGATIAYGLAQFVARVARRKGHSVIGPPSDWFLRAPARVPIRFMHVAARHGWLSPGWQRVRWRIRFVAHVLDRRMLSLELWSRDARVLTDARIWSRQGCESLPSPADGTLALEERRRAETFLETLLADAEFKIPAVFGITFGATEGSEEFLVEQLYPIFSAPFVTRQVPILLPLLPHAIRPTEGLGPEDREWILQPRSIVMLGPNSKLSGR